MFPMPTCYQEIQINLPRQRCAVFFPLPFWEDYFCPACSFFLCWGCACRQKIAVILKNSE